MEKHIHHRWYAENKIGRHIFYIEVNGSDIVDELLFESSLPYLIFSQSGIKKLINKLCIRKLSEGARDRIAKSVIEKILKLPGISQHYFTDIMLDARGKYCEAYVSVLDDIKRNATLEVFIPYSININVEIFTSLKTNFEYDGARKECILVNKKLFEESIRDNSFLQNAYAEIYYSDLEYFYYESSEDSIVMKCYCVIKNRELLFVFFTELQEVVPT